MPRDTFVAHWHQVMGGDLKKNPKLMQLGIFVRGKNSAPRSAATKTDLSELDFAKFGSLNLMVTKFPRAIPPYDFLTELKDIWEKGQIRPNAFIFLRKDKSGKISGMEGSSLQEDDDIAAINAVISTITSRSLGTPELAGSKAEVAVAAAAAGDFGLSPNDMQALAQKLQPDEVCNRHPVRKRLGAKIQRSCQGARRRSAHPAARLVPSLDRSCRPLGPRYIEHTERDQILLTLPRGHVWTALD